MAEEEGFEPSRQDLARQHAFQACALNHSATPPETASSIAERDYTEGYGDFNRLADSGLQIRPKRLLFRRGRRRTREMAKKLCRGIGWLCLALAIVAIGADGVNSLNIGHAQFTPLGAVWYRVSPATLGLAQAAIQRHVWPPLWDPAIVTVLRLPAFAVAGALGLLLLVLCRARSRRFRFGRK